MRYLRLLLLLSLIPCACLSSRPAPAAEAPVPAGEKLAWGQEPLEVLSAVRERVCLNGVWRFAPAGRQAPAANDEGWGYIRVPGDWRNVPTAPGITVAGKGPLWQGFDGNEVDRAWYERTIKVPAGWAGRAVIVELQRVSTDALVYANGTECGRVSWPAGEVDISRAVKPGEEATLRILVAAAKEDADATAILEGKRGPVRANLASRGLIGDVMLSCRPAGPHVSDVFIQPSTRRKELALTVELAGIAEAGTVKLMAHLLDGEKEEKRFITEVKVDPALVQTVRVAWPWPNPRLWDLGQPNLYTLKLDAEGAGMADEYAQRFGFREFWVQGKRFYLNGTEIRLRPCVLPAETPFFGMAEVADAAIEGFRGAGFNIQELYPWDEDERGTAEYREQYCERADAKGWALIAPALSMARYAFPWLKPNWGDAGIKEEWEKRMAAAMRPYRNHPSVLMWATSPNTFGHGDDQNPRRIGQRRDGEAWRTVDEAWQQHLVTGDDAVGLIKRHDPTRPVLVHHGGPVGDVYAISVSLFPLPLQEREEWLTEWAQRGNLPLMAVEMGTSPWSYLRGRGSLDQALLSEPLLTEYAAGVLGREAYALEAPEYRAAVAGRCEKGQWQSWQDSPLLQFSPLYQKLQSRAVAGTWRNWRASGITGGMAPLSLAYGWQLPTADQDRPVEMPPFAPGRRGTYFPQVPGSLLHFLKPEGATLEPAGKALMDGDDPTLAWIAGPPSAFFAKDHNFAAGQRVEKQVALLNDTRAAQEFSVSWKVVVDGKEVAGDTSRGHLDAGKTALLPFRFDIPGALAKPKVDGEIRLAAIVGQDAHEDRFPFRVFAKPARFAGAAPANAAKREITVFDPLGRTTKMLRLLGYSIRSWRGETDAGLVVIGRQALSGRQPLPADLGAFVRNGGRAIVFAQDPEWLEDALDLRVAHRLARQVFPVQAGHPALAGLDADDLRDWAGESDLVEPYPDYTSGDVRRSPSGSPWWGWHWGNRGAVCSAPIEKPHRSGWRPILECEFDLAYTPLMELDYGKGRLTWCSLDLEEHAALDPAAALLAQQILTYAETAPLQPRVKTLYLGGPAGAAALDGVGVLYTKAERLEPGAGLVVLGPGANVAPAELDAFLKAGGKALFLAQNGPQAPLSVSLAETKEFAGSLSVPDWPECRGLSPSDLRWRAPDSAWLLKAGCEVGAGGLLGRVAAGEGAALFCQIDPGRFNTGEKPYFRITRWRETRALAQILANLGAEFKMDARIFAPVDTERDHLSLSGKWRGQLTLKLPQTGPQDVPYPDPGITDAARKLVVEDLDDSNWPEVSLPGYMEFFGNEWANADGEAVFRKVVDVPEHLAGKDLVLSLGPVDDFDDTFFNGTLVGHTDIKTPNFWATPRVYTIPGKLVKAGKNVIAIRLFDQYMAGGFGGQPWQMSLDRKRERKPEGFYCPDYRDDFEQGDDPYRYCRW